MTKRSRVAALAASAVASVGLLVAPVAASGLINRMSDLAWALAPKPTVVDDGVSSTALGDFLFEQQLSPHSEAVPDPAHQLALSGRLGDNTPRSLRTMRFGLTKGSVNGTTYCSIVGPKSSTQRLCLIDPDDDGVFDYYARAFSAEGQFTKIQLLAKFEPIALPYTTKERRGPGLVRAGIVVHKKGDRYLARFAVDNGKRPQLLQTFEEVGGFWKVRKVDNPGVSFTEADLPATFTLHGAEIEVLAIEGKTLRYRVISPFAEDELFAIAHGGTFQ